VGELLTECDLTARRLLLDPDALDAAAMLRVWPELVQAGHELLAALPGQGPEAIPGVGIKPVHVDPVGERLHLMATALHDNLRRRTWPGDGPADDQLLTMAGNLVRARDLIDRQLRASGPPSAARQADAAAARTRVLHTLYLTAHAVSLASHAETRALHTGNRAMKSRWAANKLAALALVTTRTDVFEQVAGSEVYLSFPRALDGQKREAAAPDRLRDAAAMWEVETRRALVNSPSLGNIAELTRVQSATIALSHVLLEAAADAGAIDAVVYRTGLAPRLAAAASAWAGLDAVARDLTATGPREVSRDLRAAGSELVQALADLALDGTAIANGAALTARVQSSGVPRTLLRVLATHQDASHVLLDATLDPRTRVSAKAAQRVITDLASKSPHSASPHEPWLSPRDIANSREVPLPAPLRGALLQHIGVVGKASALVTTAAADLTPAADPPRGNAQTTGESGHLRWDRRAVDAPARSASPLAR
jgi:hypothetical protein